MRQSINDAVDLAIAGRRIAVLVSSAKEASAHVQALCAFEHVARVADVRRMTDRSISFGFGIIDFVYRAEHWRGESYYDGLILGVPDGMGDFALGEFRARTNL